MQAVVHRIRDNNYFQLPNVGGPFGNTMDEVRAHPVVAAALARVGQLRCLIVEV